jgi:hypothetical protein
MECVCRWIRNGTGKEETLMIEGGEASWAK